MPIPVFSTFPEIASDGVCAVNSTHALPAILLLSGDLDP